MSDTPDYQDVSKLTRVLHYCLGAYVLVAVVWAGSTWSEIGLLTRAMSGVFPTEAEGLANDSRQAVLGLLFFVVFMVTSIVFLRWTFVAHRNVRAMGTRMLDFGSRGAVWWYFVPIVALWKPYFALREVFKASHPDYTVRWRRAPQPALLPVWWTLWIVGGLFSQASLRSSLFATTLSHLLLSSWALFWSSMIDIPLAIVAFILTSKLASLQAQKWEVLATEGTRDPGEPRSEGPAVSHEGDGAPGLDA